MQSKSFVKKNVLVCAEKISLREDAELDSIGVTKIVHANAQLQCQLAVVQDHKYGATEDVHAFVQMLIVLINAVHLKYGTKSHAAVIVQLICKNLLTDAQNH
jgi:hypothetical protein